jgi:hypothetical protein
MERPIEGSVNVNSGTPTGELPDDLPGAPPEDIFEGHPPALSGAGDLGPCLYLGPAGQRCSRRAVEGGFCARHQPRVGQFQGLSIPQVTRRGVALIGLLAVLWPVLADIVRELIRLLR